MKLDSKIHREFEIPYQFDQKLITGLQLLNISDKYINCFYMAPYSADYQTIIRSTESNRRLLNINKQEYIKQVQYLNELYPGKIQLLLQRPKPEESMSEKKLQFYYNLGFRKFCVGSIKQASILRDNFEDIEIIGSITMHISKEKLETNNDYKKYFNGFVLDLSYPKNLTKIKNLPKKDYKYIMLVNSLCNRHCNGDNHWFPNEKGYVCPGLIHKVGFQESCLVRPMDLYFFDGDISVYKLQDRDWLISDVLRDIVLYTTNYNIYDGIIYSKNLYNKI